VESTDEVFSPGWSVAITTWHCFVGVVAVDAACAVVAEENALNVNTTVQRAVTSKI